MKNNMKAPVKFREDLLYFQHFMLIFCLCPKLVIITTLTPFINSETAFFATPAFKIKLIRIRLCIVIKLKFRRILIKISCTKPVT